VVGLEEFLAADGVLGEGSGVGAAAFEK